MQRCSNIKKWDKVHRYIGSGVLMGFKWGSNEVQMAFKWGLN